MSAGVAMVGIGMHAFGRTEGVSGMEQGVVATRRALADAGVTWSDMQFAVGGSASAGNADTLVSKLGLTGLQFTNVSNGCATGGSALFTAANTIVAGTYDLGIALGFDKHERGAFRVARDHDHRHVGPPRLADCARRLVSVYVVGLAGGVCTDGRDHGRQPIIEQTMNQLGADARHVADEAERRIRRRDGE